MARRKIRKHFSIARLHKRVRKSHKRLLREFPQVAHKLKELDFDLKDLRRHSAKMLSAAAIAGALLAATPTVQTLVTPSAVHQEKTLSPDELSQKLRNRLDLVLPQKVGPLSAEKEEQLHVALKESLGINAVASLDGNHLNTTYGYIGAEQHLPRYPGDTAEAHDAYQFKGITPGRGAWGLFVSTKAQLTQADIMKEKYYVAVQTMYLPNWQKDLRTLVKWYKHRKVLVVNPKNGKAVVAVIADAGPAAWTGKHFGGSPEVMADLALNTGMQKGAVLMFFVNDYDQTIALGPVTAEQQGLLANR